MTSRKTIRCTANRNQSGSYCCLRYSLLGITPRWPTIHRGLSGPGSGASGEVIVIARSSILGSRVRLSRSTGKRSLRRDREARPLNAQINEAIRNGQSVMYVVYIGPGGKSKGSSSPRWLYDEVGIERVVMPDGKVYPWYFDPKIPEEFKRIITRSRSTSTAIQRRCVERSSVSRGRREKVVTSNHGMTRRSTRSTT